MAGTAKKWHHLSSAFIDSRPWCTKIIEYTCEVIVDINIQYTRTHTHKGFASFVCSTCMLVAMGAWVPSCLLRECRWVDMSAVTINSCCSHLVPLLGSLFYPLVNSEQLNIACFMFFCNFLAATLPTPYIWCTSEISYLKWWEIFSDIFKPLIECTVCFEVPFFVDKCLTMRLSGMLLLIGLALFTPKAFLFSISLLFV